MTVETLTLLLLTKSVFLFKLTLSELFDSVKIDVKDEFSESVIFIVSKPVKIEA